MSASKQRHKQFVPSPPPGTAPGRRPGRTPASPLSAIFPTPVQSAALQQRGYYSDIIGTAGKPDIKVPYHIAFCSVFVD